MFEHVFESSSLPVRLYPGRVVETITPTGHHYTSHPPPAIGWAVPGERASPTVGETSGSPSVLEEKLRKPTQIA